MMNLPLLALASTMKNWLSWFSLALDLNFEKFHLLSVLKEAKKTSSVPITANITQGLLPLLPVRATPISKTIIRNQTINKIIIHLGVTINNLDETINNSSIPATTSIANFTMVEVTLLMSTGHTLTIISKRVPIMLHTSRTSQLPRSLTVAPLPHALFSNYFSMLGVADLNANLRGCNNG